ncbi:hypothetical protein ACQKCU_24685 [Heyndrickxia sporothermodurans]
MNNWITALFNTRKRQNILSMFGRKRNNKGMMWISLLGFGISAAFYGFRRNKNMLSPIQNLINKSPLRKASQMPNAALMEFSKELIPDKKRQTNK